MQRASLAPLLASNTASRSRNASAIQNPIRSRKFGKDRLKISDSAAARYGGLSSSKFKLSRCRYPSSPRKHQFKQEDQFSRAIRTCHHALSLGVNKERKLDGAPGALHPKAKEADAQPTIGKMSIRFKTSDTRGRAQGGRLPHAEPAHVWCRRYATWIEIQG